MTMRCALPSTASAAFTLVELLVVTLIVACFALFAGPAYLRSSRLERNLRDEAYVRTRLVLCMERMVREISLAKSVAWDDPETRETVAVGVSSSLDFPATNYAVSLFYPEETGGVSFETNRIANVSSVRFSPGREWMDSSASNRVSFSPAVQRRRLTADPVFLGTAGRSRISGFCITNVVSDGAVQSNLLHVTLSAVVDLDDGNGGKHPKTISVGRFARMWNR